VVELHIRIPVETRAAGTNGGVAVAFIGARESIGFGIISVARDAKRSRHGGSQNGVDGRRTGNRGEESGE
jgi:hypothetical protein